MDLLFYGTWKLWACWGSGCYGTREYGFRLMRQSYQTYSLGVYDTVVEFMIYLRRRKQ